MRRLLLVLIKSVHTAAFLVIAGSILVVFADGARSRPRRRTGVAAAIALGECAVFAANGFVCPLTPLAERYGAERGSVDGHLPARCHRAEPGVDRDPDPRRRASCSTGERCGRAAGCRRVVHVLQSGRWSGSGIRELRNYASRVVARARAGERILITVDGVPAAEIGPIAGPPRERSLEELIAAGLVVAPREPNEPAGEGAPGQAAWSRPCIGRRGRRPRPRPVIFLDTSALVKRYVDENGSRTVMAAMDADSVWLAAADRPHRVRDQPVPTGRARIDRGPADLGAPARVAPVHGHPDRRTRASPGHGRSAAISGRGRWTRSISRPPTACHPRSPS